MEIYCGEHLVCTWRIYHFALSLHLHTWVQIWLPCKAQREPELHWHTVRAVMQLETYFVGLINIVITILITSAINYLSIYKNCKCIFLFQIPEFINQFLKLPKRSGIQQMNLLIKFIKNR